jgi:hypothetical protein
MMLRMPVQFAFKRALKAFMLATLCAAALLVLSVKPAAADGRVSFGISVGVPIHDDGWRHGYYGHYGRYGYYRHHHHYGHGRYSHYGHYPYGRHRHGGFYFSYSAPIVVAPYPRVYPAPVYPAPAYGYGAAGVPSYCREFRTTININGMIQPAWGTACLQPDGTWRFVD